MLACDCAIASGARELLLSLVVASPAGPGHYLAFGCEQLDGQGQVLARQAEVLDLRGDGGPLRLLLHLQAGAGRLRLRLAHAHEPLAVRLAASELCFLEAGRDGLPLAALGLAAEPERIAAPSKASRQAPSRYAADAAWAARHLTPWLLRRARGVSSGDGREPKRPELLPVLAD